MAKKAGPLAGIRVLEMGRLIAAPFCGQILGDLGADVIKVERAGGGDDIRGYGPPFLLNDAAPGGESTYYIAYNRNKRSIIVDFSQPAGADLVRRLAAKSDVFIENYKVGSLKKYGLDEASLRKINERLVYLSVSGFGQTGPYADRPATDVVVQGMGGIMSVTGELGGEPMKVGVSVVDMVTGLQAAIGVIASLYQRDTAGAPGSWVNVSLLESCLSLMGAPAAWQHITGEAPLRVGNEAMGSSPSGVFKCSDGDILFNAGKDADFVKLCKVLGLEQLIDDPRFVRRALRVENMTAINALLQEAIGKWKRQDFYDAMINAGVICGPINDVGEALAESQVVHSGTSVLANHPEDKALPLIGSPIRFGEEALPVTRHPPRLGEHTFDVLAEVLGMDKTAMDKLAGEGVISGLRPRPAK